MSIVHKPTSKVYKYNFGFQRTDIFSFHATTAVLISKTDVVNFDFVFNPFAVLYSIAFVECLRHVNPREKFYF